MDLVGAAVLSHAHNAESMVDIREELGVEKSALGEEDAVAHPGAAACREARRVLCPGVRTLALPSGPRPKEHGGDLDHGGARGWGGGGWPRGHRALGQDTWASAPQRHSSSSAWEKRRRPARTIKPVGAVARDHAARGERDLRQRNHRHLALVANSTGCTVHLSRVHCALLGCEWNYFESWEGTR